MTIQRGLLALCLGPALARATDTVDTTDSGMRWWNASVGHLHPSYPGSAAGRRWQYGVYTDETCTEPDTAVAQQFRVQQAELEGGCISDGTQSYSMSTCPELLRHTGTSCSGAGVPTEEAYADGECIEVGSSWRKLACTSTCLPDEFMCANATRCSSMEYVGKVVKVCTGPMVPLCIPLRYVRDSFYDCIEPPYELSHDGGRKVMDGQCGDTLKVLDLSDERSTELYNLKFVVVVAGLGALMLLYAIGMLFGTTAHAYAVDGIAKASNPGGRTVVAKHAVSGTTRLPVRDHRAGP